MYGTRAVICVSESRWVELVLRTAAVFASRYSFVSMSVSVRTLLASREDQLLPRYSKRWLISDGWYTHAAWRVCIVYMYCTHTPGGASWGSGRNCNTAWHRFPITTSCSVGMVRTSSCVVHSLLHYCYCLWRDFSYGPHFGLALISWTIFDSRWRCQLCLSTPWTTLPPGQSRQAQPFPGNLSMHLTDVLTSWRLHRISLWAAFITL